jgi:hypothetical protein
VSAEIERPTLDALAERWRGGWQGAGFEACCTPDVSYEDPVAGWGRPRCSCCVASALDGVRPDYFTVTVPAIPGAWTRQT